MGSRKGKTGAQRSGSVSPRQLGKSAFRHSIEQDSANFGSVGSLDRLAGQCDGAEPALGFRRHATGRRIKGKHRPILDAAGQNLLNVAVQRRAQQQPCARRAAAGIAHDDPLAAR